MVDAESIDARIERLSRLLEELEAIRADGHDAYVADFRSQLAANHAIQLAVQVCIDVGAHLIAELGLEAPTDYKNIFESLRTKGLDPQLAERLAKAAGMRNILVHGYLEVDIEAVWQALDHLDDIRQFAAFAQSQLGD